VTKQRETRDRVFDLIDRLGVGEAIPSERQLTRPTISDISVLRSWIQSCLVMYGSDVVAPSGDQ